MCCSVARSSGPVLINSQHRNKMITDIKSDYITVMFLLVITQGRCWDTVVYLQADVSVSESSKVQFSFHCQFSVIREVSTSLFPWQIHWTNACLQGNGSSRANGLYDAVVPLPCVVTESYQMGYGFPVTAEVLHLVCTEAQVIAVPSLLAMPLLESNTSYRSREGEKTCFS